MKFTRAIAKIIKKQKVFFKSYLFIILGNMILAFGIYNIHTYAHIGEIGFLGITLFLYQFLGINPAFTAIFLNLCCCLLGFYLLDKQGVIYSLVSGFSFQIFYMIFNLFPRILPELYHYPLVAAILGGALVGAGMGICNRFGTSPFGDEGFTCALRYTLNIPIKFTIFAVDIIALILAFIYIPMGQYPYTLLSAFISACIVSLIQNIKF